MFADNIQKVFFDERKKMSSVKGDGKIFEVSEGEEKKQSPGF